MTSFHTYLQQFIQYLKVEKNASDYTVMFYEKDLQMFLHFLKGEGLENITDINPLVVRVFLTELYKRKLSRKSVSRTLSCLRTFFKYLEKDCIVEQNPFIHIPLPKQDKRIPTFLYQEELQLLFEVSDVSTPLGQRDQALLEMMYATGIRVSECQQL